MPPPLLSSVPSTSSVLITASSTTAIMSGDVGQVSYSCRLPNPSEILDTNNISTDTRVFVPVLNRQDKAVDTLDKTDNDMVIIQYVPSSCDGNITEKWVESSQDYSTASGFTESTTVPEKQVSSVVATTNSSNYDSSSYQTQQIIST